MRHKESTYIIVIGLLVLAIIFGVLLSILSPQTEIEDIFDYKARTVTVLADNGEVWRCLVIDDNGYNDHMVNCENTGKVIKPQ